MNEHERHEEEEREGCCGGEEHEEEHRDHCWGAYGHEGHHGRHHPFGQFERWAGEWPRGAWGGFRGFGPGMHFRRHFPTREERIACLEQYLKDLQAEAKAVEERIAELRAGK